MNGIEITKITLDHLVPLQEIGRQTFWETFSPNNTEENMNGYLASSFSDEKLANELQNPESEFYFAAINGIVVGYLKINFGQTQTESQQVKTLEIERIYVRQEFHGKNVGQLLYEKAIQIAKTNYLDFVWLGVWENNHKALRFYTKNGFVAFDKHIFKLGDEEQTDLLMKLDLANK